MAVTLVTGPVRSGKSRFAAGIARRSGLRVTYVATSRHDPDDREWESRLARHRADRPAEWTTVETATLDDDEVYRIFAAARAGECLVVDALGTWVAARLDRGIDAFIEDPSSYEATLERDGELLVAAMLASRARVVLVAEEVGWDVVPSASSARVFRDVVGRLKQRIAAGAERTYLIVSGLAIDLTSLGDRVE